MFNQYRSANFYIEPITNAQVLIRRQRNDDILSLVSLYTVLYRDGTFEAGIFQQNGATTALNSVTRDYTNGYLAIKAFEISGDSPSIKAKLVGTRNNSQLRLEYTLQPLINTANKEFLIGIEFNDLEARISERQSKKIVLRTDNCSQFLDIVLGQYVETRKNILIFKPVDNSKLDITTTYVCD